MMFGEKRRTYIANTLSKIAEFVSSILVIGYLIAIKLEPELKLDLIFLLSAGALAIILIFSGMWVTPEKEA